MMTSNLICCIDDGIPVNQFAYCDDTKLIDSSVLNYLLENVVWNDIALKELIRYLLPKKDALSKEDTWDVTAFGSPNFFFNHTRNRIFSPDVIIYDWEYGPAAPPPSSKDSLLKLLKETYSVIYIYTGTDAIEEVSQTIKEEGFKKYTDRIDIIEKGDLNSATTMMEAVQQRRASNFSFKFGQELMYKSNSALNKILSEISALSINQFIDSFGTSKEPSCNIDEEDFVDVIYSKCRQYLYDIKFNIKPEESPNAEQPKDYINVIRNIWSYRMYQAISRKEVRMGDIVKNDETNKLYLVISSDCHMHMFWKKNGGYIAMVPLHKIDTSSNDPLKNQLKVMKPDTAMHSLTSNNSSITVLPAVPVSDNEKIDFLIIPKEISSQKIFPPKPEGNKGNIRNVSLKYELWDKYKGVVSISDPFKSPLIQFVMDNITGYGCPDYPNELQNNIQEQLEKLRKE